MRFISMRRSNKDNLKRDIHRIPKFVSDALRCSSLMAAYRDRPAYQQNDYIGWINEAKRDDTKQKRLSQMLAELEQGGVYMKMDHPPSRKRQ